MSLSVKYSWAISDNNTDLGLKLSNTEAISTGCIISVALLQDPSRTIPRRIAYAAAFSGHLDRAHLINDQ